MEKFLKSTYWLILIAAVGILLVCGMIPEESYANMRSEAVWQTGLQTSAVKVSADYLIAGSQTVLLKDLTEARTVELTFSTNRQSVNGTLRYSVTPQNAVSVTAPETVTATTAGTKAELVLTPIAVAQDTDVVLSLVWTGDNGETLQGDFRFVVPSAGNQEEPQLQNKATESTITAMEKFVPGTAIAVTVGHPADCRQIAISLAGETFPAGTRYSTEYDQQEFVLFDPMPIRLQINGGKQTMVRITLPPETVSGTVTIQADVIGSDYVTQLQAQSTPLSGNLDLPEHYFYSLKDGSSFTLPFSGGWSGCTMSYTVQRLTQTPQGIKYETIVNTGSQGLLVNSNANGITISLTGKDLPAGTYQLLLVWNYQTYIVAQQEVTFHVSYPERSTVQTGGNVA